MKKLNKILIIDDDEISNFLFVELIQQLSVARTHKFITDAKEGLEYLVKCFSSINEQNSPPDIIFLDFRMPVMDGKEFIEELNNKKLQCFHWFNIIIISSGINQKDKDYFLNLGVKGFLEKPMTEEKILNVIQRVKPVNYLKMK